MTVNDLRFLDLHSYSRSLPLLLYVSCDYRREGKLHINLTSDKCHSATAANTCGFAMSWSCAHKAKSPC